MRRSEKGRGDRRGGGRKNVEKEKMVAKAKDVPSGPHVDQEAGSLSISPDSPASCRLSCLKPSLLSSCWEPGRTYQEDVPETSRG